MRRGQLVPPLPQQLLIKGIQLRFSEDNSHLMAAQYHIGSMTSSVPKAHTMLYMPPVYTCTLQNVHSDPENSSRSQRGQPFYKMISIKCCVTI